MNLIPENDQHIGAREEQQDTFGFGTEEPRFQYHGGFVAVVADGMGGMQMGRESSQLAFQTFRHAYEAKRPDETIPDALLRAVRAANKAVYDMALQADLVEKAGTTVVAAVVHQQTLYWISVGDSHIYLFREGHLAQLNVDHIYAEHLKLEVEQGTISQAQADADPERNSLTSFLGIEELTEIDRNLKPFSLRPGDRIVLCSDGLYGTLPEQEIVHLLDASPAGHAATALTKATLARKKPGQDNVTVAIINIPGSTVLTPDAEPSTRRQEARLHKKTIWLVLLGVFLLGSATTFLVPRALEVAKRLYTSVMPATPQQEEAVTPAPQDSALSKEPTQEEGADTTSLGDKKKEEEPNTTKEETKPPSQPIE